MHEMQGIIIDACGVSRSVYHEGSFSAAFTQLLWPRVCIVFYFASRCQLYFDERVFVAR